MVGPHNTNRTATSPPCQPNHSIHHPKQWLPVASHRTAPGSGVGRSSLHLSWCCSPNFICPYQALRLQRGRRKVVLPSPPESASGSPTLPAYLLTK